jgi:predicted ATPase
MPEATASSTVLVAGSRADPASFLGRTQELELIRRLLVGGPARLRTLTGPAGVGKTRLALEAGQRFGDAFPDGVWFTELTPLRDPAQVPSALAEGLGGPPEAGSRVATQLLEEALALRQQLGDRRGAANVHTQLAAIALGQRAYERAEHLAQAALVTYREVGG